MFCLDRTRRALALYNVYGDSAQPTISYVHTWHVYTVYLSVRLISSVESQKGVIAVQRCPVQNQRGTVAINFVQR